VVARLLEIEFLLRTVELDDGVARLDRIAGVGHVHDLELAAHRRHGQLRRARGAQVADGVDRDLDAPVLDVRRRHRLRQRRRDAPNDGNAGDEQHHDRDGGVADHLAPSWSGSFSATRSPSRRPDAMAICSRPRRRTVTGRFSTPFLPTTYTTVAAPRW